ncbi:hypothetical protein GLYMA_18G207350v4 [Glycine max]|nr:hypothetical protein GLYMA_18G207350v4 [Glycine max]
MAEKAKGRKKKSCHLIVHHQPPQMLASMKKTPEAIKEIRKFA